MTFDAAATPTAEYQPDAVIAAAPPVAPLPAPNPIKDAAAASAPAVSEDAAAVASAKPTPAKPTPAFAPTFPLSDGKRTEFLHAVAAKIRTRMGIGRTEAEIIPDLRRDCEALAKALDPQGEVAKTATQLLTKEFNAMIVDPHCHVPESEQARAIYGIFFKRQAEVQHTFNLLSDQNFLNEASALATSGKDTSAPHLFDDAKREETINELVSDAGAHTLPAAFAQHMMHKALSTVWKIDGDLAPVLIKAIHDAAPALTDGEATEIANNWLHGRFHLADIVAKETKVGSGSIYNEAMKRTEAKIHPAKPQALKEEAPAVAASVAPAVSTAPAVAPIAPAALAAAPVQHEGALVNPELAPAI